MNLLCENCPRPTAGSGEVLVEIHANAMNRGDLAMLGTPVAMGGPSLEGMIPLTDGAGEVVAVGAGVTEYSVGDRVVGTYFIDWEDDSLPPLFPTGRVRGASPDGMLSEVIVTSPNYLLPIPDYMSYEEAAALPCTGVTAWNALFNAANIQSSDTVVFEGTGGMSTIGLQLAVAQGARSIITSSSNEKLERAAEIGAIGTINYREMPEWSTEIRNLTDGRGADMVLDIGGERTQDQALSSLAYRGHLLIAGVLTGEGIPLIPRDMVLKGIHASGVLVGSHDDFAALLDFMREHEIHPLIDRVFPSDQATDAYDFMENGSYMGKIVISMQ